jgi:hypothetical protein
VARVALTEVEGLVVIGLHLPVVLVGQQVLLQQTLEASDMPADLLDLILQMEMCKVLIQPVMQLLPEALVQMVPQAQMEGHQPVRLLEAPVLRVVSELLAALVLRED